MKVTIGLLLVCLSLSVACAQTPFIDDLYPLSSIQISTKTYTDKSEKELQLDIYQSSEDTTLNRPVILYIHGGAFKMGTRDYSKVKEYCKNWASRGYVAVSMSYTLYMKGKSFHCDQPNSEKVKAVHIAMNDARKATAWLIKNKTQLRIDPSKIIISGSSAGAETGLHLAFIPADSVTLGKQVLTDNFKYAGLISYAGAIVDTNLITYKTKMPTALFHGTCDNLVPFGTSPHHYCATGTPGDLMLSGSRDIYTRLTHLNASAYLSVTCGAGHEINMTPMETDFDDTCLFIYSSVIKGKKTQQVDVIHTDKTCNLSKEYLCTQ